jgi:hypothetical protein
LGKAGNPSGKVKNQLGRVKKLLGTGKNSLGQGNKRDFYAWKILFFPSLTGY